MCEVDADCGDAMTCWKDYDLFGDPTLPTFSICLGATCEDNDDCPDDLFCAINGNGEEGDALDWEHICATPAPESAALGETCDTDPEDTEVLPECGVGPCLTSGTCSQICELDADCATAADTLLCDALEIGADFDDDGVNDKFLPLGLCVDYPGSQAACSVNGDCPDGEACTFRAFTTPGGSLDGIGLCVTVGPEEADIGEACGGNSGVTCKSGFCLAANGDQPGYCTHLCETAADCPNAMTLGLFDGVYNMYCTALSLLQGDPDAPDDTVYIPLCLPNVGSLDGCEADFLCASAEESCVGAAWAIGADGGTNAEYLCFGQEEGGAADGAAGDVCLNDGECGSFYCIEGDGVLNKCSTLCKSDDDCTVPGTTCSPFLVIDRQNDADDLTVPLCQFI